MLTRSDRESILNKIEKLVAEKFYDPTFGGKSWPSIVNAHRTQILDSADDSAFESTVSRMLGEVGTSGLGLLGRETKVNSRNSINASFRSVNTSEDGTRWVFQDILPGGVASRGGLHPADVLVSVNGVEVLPPQTPAFGVGATTPLVISRNGERKELKITLHSVPPKYKDNPYAEPQSVKASLGPQAVGNLKISLFPGKIGIDFANQVDSIFAGELAGAERLIIDLRGNPGGGIGGLRVMSYLTAAKQPIGYSLDRRMAQKREKPDQLPRFGKIPKSKFEIPLLALKYGGKRSVALETEGLGAKKFHGKIVLLVNEHSTGAAEMVTQFAKENALAKIVGTKTPGRLVSRSAFPVGLNYRITIPVAAYVSWNGDKVEGRGIEPDVPVDWSYQDALAGVDNQLERAVAVALAM